MAWVQFRCSALGTFRLNNYATYEQYKRVYPDIEPVPNGKMFRNIYNELEDYEGEL